MWRKLPLATSIGSSCPVPLVAFSYRFQVPLRLAPNTIRSPVGDHTGPTLVEASVVRRRSAPRVRSHSHKSATELEFVVRRRYMSDFSSGEIAGSKTGPGAATVPPRVPVRSYQAIWDSYVRTPPL